MRLYYEVTLIINECFKRFTVGVKKLFQRGVSFSTLPSRSQRRRTRARQVGRFSALNMALVAYRVFI